MSVPFHSSPSVLHVAWNAIRGGTEGQCARVALQFPNHQVALFRREGFFLAALDEHCGPVYEIRIERLLSPTTIKEVRRLARWMGERGFDWVHTWDADAAIFGGLAARWAGVPLITSRRDMGEIYPAWKLKCMQWADSHARYVVANAEAIKNWRVREGIAEDKIFCIPNILDVDEFDQCAQGQGPELPAGRWMAFVARLDPEKDVGTAIRALALLHSQYPDLGLAIAGDGVERAEAERLAAAEGVSNRVRFLGDMTEIPALLRQCALGLLTPRANEGLSNTILEYMAASLPVVATDCGGNRELVENGVTGYIVPVGDAQGVATGVKNLLDAPAQREKFGAAARRRVENTHRPELVAQRFADLYALP